MSPWIPTVIRMVRNTSPWSWLAPGTPASSSRRANRLATAAVTIPRGASQASSTFWAVLSGNPAVASSIASGRTTSISTSTQATPPRPSGLRSPQDRSAASSGKRMLIANWAS